jgi:toxin FitB
LASPLSPFWTDRRDPSHISSFTGAELAFGIAALPNGKPKDKLTSVLDGVLELFADRILPFDSAAARHYGDFAMKARGAGKGFSTPHGYVTAIAASPPATRAPSWPPA